MASCKNDFLCALIANLQFLEIYSELFEPIDLDPIISDACMLLHMHLGPHFLRLQFFFALGEALAWSWFIASNQTVMNVMVLWFLHERRWFSWPIFFTLAGQSFRKTYFDQSGELIACRYWGSPFWLINLFICLNQVDVVESKVRSARCATSAHYDDQWTLLSLQLRLWCGISCELLGQRNNPIIEIMLNFVYHWLFVQLIKDLLAIT